MTISEQRNIDVDTSVEHAGEALQIGGDRHVAIQVIQREGNIAGLITKVQKSTIGGDDANWIDMDSLNGAGDMNNMETSMDFVRYKTTQGSAQASTADIILQVS